MQKDGHTFDAFARITPSEKTHKILRNVFKKHLFHPEKRILCTTRFCQTFFVLKFPPTAGNHLRVKKAASKKLQYLPRRLYLTWAPNTDRTPVPVRSPFLLPFCRMCFTKSRYPRSSHRNPDCFSTALRLSAASQTDSLRCSSLWISEVAGISTSLSFNGPDATVTAQRSTTTVQRLPGLILPRNWRSVMTSASANKVFVKNKKKRFNVNISSKWYFTLFRIKFLGLKKTFEK